MNYVRGFAPWICYGALSAFDWRLGMCTAAVVAVLLLLGARRRGDADLLSAVTCGFFVVMAAVAVGDPTSGLHRWTGALVNAALAVTALTSLAVGKPFTLAIARSQVPQEYWNSPRFVHVNTVLTRVWAAAFVGAAVACAVIVGYADSNTAALVTAQVLGFVVPLVFSTRYVTHARAAAAAHGAQLAP
ncbi:hypothetical protein GXW82_15505 [Streptacidiphilus sp. 4-A2]|nr:hypothetical protein [Streptacidiphilus sp. 4-A2]